MAAPEPALNVCNHPMVNPLVERFVSPVSRGDRMREAYRVLDGPQASSTPVGRSDPQQRLDVFNTTTIEMLDLLGLGSRPLWQTALWIRNKRGHDGRTPRGKWRF